jgi:hypothetical protein
MVRRTIKEAAEEFISGKFHRIRECDQFIAALGKYPELRHKIKEIRDAGHSICKQDVEYFSSHRDHELFRFGDEGIKEKLSPVASLESKIYQSQPHKTTYINDEPDEDSDNQ